MNRTQFYILIALLSLGSCKKAPEKKPEEASDKETLFTLLSNTGIDFTNRIENTDDFNIFTYRNFYNGGGVAIADINNDGLSDVYMTSNMEQNRLYLNKGNFEFEDISSTAGVGGGHAWSTGVVMVDINNDQLLDIYVCNAGNVVGDNQQNELFINNGDLTFTEKAAEYGLADSGFTTHAAFFDYDGDGDLDAYILNNSFIPVNTLGYENKRDIRGKDWDINPIFIGGGDKLLKNEGGKFIDVSEEAGIYGSLIGFGLGVTVGDVNNDFLPDIYVSNDFYERDYLYINNGDGTFSEKIKDWASHLSLSSMGADMSDINNDGYPEIFVTDMLPRSDTRLKEVSEFERYDLYKLKVDRDFHHQYMQNTLQLNNGNETFSEIAFYSGVAETDWSWGALIFDMDNDGYKDIYVSNGVYHDLTNQDFMDFFANDIIQRMAVSGEKESIEEVIDKMPTTPISNYAFQNNKNLTFTNQNKNWGLDEPSFSNGAAFGDLDNDGDLDLVVNNINQKAFVYRNESDKRVDHNYLAVDLKGSKENTYGIGSIVEVYTGDMVLRQELIPSRGFQSSIDYRMIFGLGNIQKIDSVSVIWPDKTVQHKVGPETNQVLTFDINKETSPLLRDAKEKSNPYFKEMEVSFEPHKENDFVDFDYQGLISFMLSREGPTISVGDINNDGLDDVFMGGAKDQEAHLYVQQPNGKFRLSESLSEDAVYEDTASLLFDVDGDGDLDLYVGSGGNEGKGISRTLTDRLYLNNGKGDFSLSESALPITYNNTSVVCASDTDDDGDLDLFVGSRSIPGTYGVDPENYLLENDGNGHFKNITETKAFDLKKIGMITDATWIDISGDGKEDLIVVGDWMSPAVFETGNRGRLSIVSGSLDQLTGLWNTLAAEDLDQDGDVDLVLGNRGTNNFCKTSPESPAKIFINDFDNNGTIEQIMTRNIDGKDVPIPLRRELSGQLSSLKKEILKSGDYAKMSIEDLFKEEIISNSIIKSASTFESVVAYNNGKGNFEVVPLPQRTQFSSVYKIKVFDLNKDGIKDLILGGNNYNFKPQFTRTDASYGEVLLGTPDRGFKSVPNKASGFFVKGQIRDLEWLTGSDGSKKLLVGINNEATKVFELNE